MLIIWFWSKYCANTFLHTFCCVENRMKLGEWTRIHWRSSWSSPWLKKSEKCSTCDAESYRASCFGSCSKALKGDRPWYWVCWSFRKPQVHRPGYRAAAAGWRLQGGYIWLMDSQWTLLDSHSILKRRLNAWKLRWKCSITDRALNGDGEEWWCILCLINTTLCLRHNL